MENESDLEYLARTNKLQEAIDFTIKYATDARWDIVVKAMETFKSGCQKKIIDDRGWNYVVYGRTSGTSE